MAARKATLTERVLAGRNRALQALARGAELSEVLGTLTMSAEECFPELRCSILLLEAGRLHHCSSPSLPEFYVRAINGLEIGPTRGSCGAAAALGQRVVVEDVLVHPNWAPFRELAARAEFRACWSEPFFSSTGEVLGTFAQYYFEPRKPRDSELEFIASTAHLAGIAVERKKGELSLRDSEEKFRQLAENIGGVFWLTDWINRRMLYVSPTWEELWGSPQAVLFGENRQAWADNIVVEDRERVLSTFYREAEQGSYDVDFRVRHADGRVRWLHERSFPIRDPDGRVVRMAGIAEDITDRKRVEEELRRARDEIEALRKVQVESLASELLLAEECERRRLALDLHDGLNQTLTLVRLKLGRLFELEPEVQQEEVRGISALVDQANQSARSLTFQLSPPILHDLGFEPAVQWLVEDVGRTYRLNIGLEGPEDASPLSERLRVLLFRAVRELLINVAKHAGARRALVRLERGASEIRVVVEDDGQAFDPAIVGSRGLGLSTIRERLSHLGGAMTLASNVGFGTRVTLVAPLERQG